MRQYSGLVFGHVTVGACTGGRYRKSPGLEVSPSFAFAISASLASATNARALYSWASKRKRDISYQY
jgi:hypothetical protein